MIDFIKLCREQGIPFATEGFKHCRAGWVQIHCPYCGNRDKWFMGYSLESGGLSCWNCGKHGLTDTLRLILRCDRDEAKALVRKYQIGKGKCSVVQVRVSSKAGASKLRMPAGCGPMGTRHMKYLTGRKFDAEMLERVWGLQGTGPIGDYRNRIILPIYLDGVPVSYQGRDFTGTSKIPYKACPMEQEVIHHKHILYGVDLVPGDTAVLVEGAADAWRLGPGALATFGTGFTLPQLNLFCRRFKRAFILFDPEEAAQQRADMAGALLAARRIPTEILCLTGEGDPGDLKQDDANHLMRGLL